MVVFPIVVCYESSCGFLWSYFKSVGSEPRLYCVYVMLGVCCNCIVFSMDGCDSDVIGIG